MKLASYQIELISNYLDEQNIWYADLREELLDHVASSIEERSQGSEDRFPELLGEQLVELDINTIQAERVKREFRNTLQSILEEMLSMLKSKMLLVLIVLFSGILLLFLKTNLLELPIIEGIAILGLIPFLSVYPYFKSKALLHNIFKVRISVVVFSVVFAFVLNQLTQSFLPLVILPILNCVLVWFLTGAYAVLQRTLNSIKVHGAV